MMLEKAGAVLEEIPDDENIQAKDDGELPGETGVEFAAFDQFVAVDEFENFNGDEECGFASPRRRHGISPGVELLR